jgi:hypothetical protein
LRAFRQASEQNRLRLPADAISSFLLQFWQAALSGRSLCSIIRFLSITSESYRVTSSGIVFRAVSRTKSRFLFWIRKPWAGFCREGGTRWGGAGACVTGGRPSLTPIQSRSNSRSPDFAYPGGSQVGPFLRLLAETRFTSRASTSLRLPSLLGSPVAEDDQLSCPPTPYPPVGDYCLGALLTAAGVFHCWRGAHR